jgi:hypothetical protein
VRIALAIVMLMSGVASWGQKAGTSRFEAVEIYVDAGDHGLGAYQLEFWSVSKGIRISGIEGGEKPFSDPPHYDPKALQRERVVIAAFTLISGEGRGSVRVATVHLQVTGNASPDYRVRIITAADSEGRKISTKSVVRRKS